MDREDHLDDSSQTIETLHAKVKRLEQTQKINETLLEISNAVDTTPNLKDLYVSIHGSLNRLIDVRNIYISIYDRENSLLHFPYFIDEVDGNYSSAVSIFVEDSLTGEVILNTKPLFLDRAALLERQKGKKIVGSAPQVYIGVPLIADNMAFGVLAIQDYHNPEAYSQKDLDMMIYVSRQIAIAIERKRLNDALKENEKRYRTLSEKSHDIIMRFDKSCRHLYVNPAIRKLGLTPAQMIGKTHNELNFSKDLVKTWEDSIQDVFQTRKVKRIEFKLPQGVWLDWLLCPEFSDNDQVNSVLTFARDITERKQMEFHNSCYDRINKIIIDAADVEQMLDGILDKMLEIFDCDRSWILFPCDPDADYYRVPFLKSRPQWYVAPGARFDITPETGRSLKEIIRSDGPLVFDSTTNRKIKSEMRDERQVKSQMIMAVFPKTGQAWGIGLHQCSYDRVWTNDDSLLFKGICRRITDGLSSMLLFKELSRAKNYIDNVVDSMPSILIGVDFNGNILQWNSKAGQVTGISSKLALGKPFVNLFPHLTQFQKIIKGAIAGQKIIEKPKLPYLVDGETRYENITVYPLKDTDIQGAVIRMDDVSEQMQIEEMMIQSEKMLSVGGLAAGMAHEINNPLAGMIQNAQVLLNRLTADIPANKKVAGNVGTTMDTIKAYMEERKVLQLVEHINDAGKRAAEIVRNMLSFSQKAEGNKSAENIPQLLNNTIELAKNDYNLKKRFNFKKVKIHQSCDKGFPTVPCEPSKIQQVFLNIIKNGTEAMAEYNLPIHRDSKFHIRYFVDSPFAVIQIKDNGPGMNQDTRKRIFEPFFTTKPPDIGTGLGLSVSFFIIVEDHNGELSVESSPDQGTVFSIKLPLRD